jgi:hypothetical protein
VSTTARVGYRRDVRALETVSFGEESNILGSPSIVGRGVVYTQSGVHGPLAAEYIGASTIVAS